VNGFDQKDNFSRLVTVQDHSVAVGILIDWIEERNGRDALWHGPVTKYISRPDPFSVGNAISLNLHCG
jgi:hypothetical protein